MSHTAQDRINGIQQVGTHHTYLVYHQQFQIAQQTLFRAAHLHLGKEFLAFYGGREKQLRGQLKKGMNRYPFGIDGGHARWCHHHHLFRTFDTQLAKQSGFSVPALPVKRYCDWYASHTHKPIHKVSSAVLIIFAKVLKFHNIYKYKSGYMIFHIATFLCFTYLQIVFLYSNAPIWSIETSFGDKKRYFPRATFFLVRPAKLTRSSCITL